MSPEIINKILSYRIPHPINNLICCKFWRSQSGHTLHWVQNPEGSEWLSYKTLIWTHRVFQSGGERVFY